MNFDGTLQFSVFLARNVCQNFAIRDALYVSYLYEVTRADSIILVSLLVA